MAIPDSLIYVGQLETLDSCELIVVGHDRVQVCNTVKTYLRNSSAVRSGHTASVYKWKPGVARRDDMVSEDHQPFTCVARYDHRGRLLKL